MSFSRLRTFAATTTTSNSNNSGGGSIASDHYILQTTENPLTDARLLRLSHRGASNNAHNNNYNETSSSSVLADIALSGGSDDLPTCCDATRVSDTLALAVGYQSGVVRVNDLADGGWVASCAPPAELGGGVSMGVGSSSFASSPYNNTNGGNDSITGGGGTTAGASSSSAAATIVRWNPFFGGQLLVGYGAYGAVSLFSSPCGTSLRTRLMRGDHASAAVVAAEWAPCGRGGFGGNGPSSFAPHHSGAYNINDGINNTAPSSSSSFLTPSHAAISTALKGGFSVSVVDFRSADVRDELRLGSSGGERDVGGNGNGGGGGGGTRRSMSARNSQVGAASMTSEQISQTVVAASGLAFHPTLPVLATYGNALVSSAAAMAGVGGSCIGGGNTTNNGSAFAPSSSSSLAPIIQLWDLRSSSMPIAHYVCSSRNGLSRALDLSGGVWEMLWARVGGNNTTSNNEASYPYSSAEWGYYSPVALFGARPFESSDAAVSCGGGEGEEAIEAATSTIGLLSVNGVDHRRKRNNNNLQSLGSALGGHQHHGNSGGFATSSNVNGASPLLATTTSAGSGSSGITLPMTTKVIGEPITSIIPITKPCGTSKGEETVLLCAAQQGYLLEEPLAAHCNNNAPFAAANHNQSGGNNGTTATNEYALVPQSQTLANTTAAPSSPIINKARRPAFIERADVGFGVCMATNAHVLARELMEARTTSSTSSTSCGEDNAALANTTAWLLAFAVNSCVSSNTSSQQQQLTAAKQPATKTTAPPPTTFLQTIADEGFIMPPNTCSNATLTSGIMGSSGDDELSVLRKLLQWPTTTAEGKTSSASPSAIPWLSSVANLERSAFIAYATNDLSGCANYLREAVGMLQQLSSSASSVQQYVMALILLGYLVDDRSKQQANSNTSTVPTPSASTVMSIRSGINAMQHDSNTCGTFVSSSGTYASLLLDLMEGTTADELLVWAWQQDRTTATNGKAPSYATTTGVVASIFEGLLVPYDVLLMNISATTTTTSNSTNSKATDNKVKEVLQRASILPIANALLPIHLLLKGVNDATLRAGGGTNPSAAAALMVTGTNEGTNNAAAGSAVINPLSQQQQRVTNTTTASSSSASPSPLHQQHQQGAYTLSTMEDIQCAIGIFATIGIAHDFKVLTIEADEKELRKRGGLQPTGAKGLPAPTPTTWRLWHEQYRRQLDSSADLIMLRAEYDLSLRQHYNYGLVATRDGTLVPSTTAKVEVEFLHSCEKALRTSASPNYGSSSTPYNPPHMCVMPLPKCGVCGISVERFLPSALSQPSEWFAWCTSCGHGGHSGHLNDWFARHELCPFPMCPCRCRSSVCEGRGNISLMDTRGAVAVPPSASSGASAAYHPFGGSGGGAAGPTSSLGASASHHHHGSHHGWDGIVGGGGGAAGSHPASVISGHHTHASSSHGGGVGGGSQTHPISGGGLHHTHSNTNAPAGGSSTLANYTVRPNQQHHDHHPNHQHYCQQHLDGYNGSRWGDVAYRFVEFPSAAAVGSGGSGGQGK